MLNDYCTSLISYFIITKKITLIYNIFTSSTKGYPLLTDIITYLIPLQYRFMWLCSLLFDTLLDVAIENCAQLR